MTLTVQERSWRRPEDKCSDSCCQCACPMDRGGRIWHRPERPTGMLTPDYERLCAEQRRAEEGQRPLATRCWEHNDPDNPDRRTHHSKLSNFDPDNLVKERSGE